MVQVSRARSLTIRQFAPTTSQFTIRASATDEEADAEAAEEVVLAPDVAHRILQRAKRGAGAGMHRVQR